MDRWKASLPYLNSNVLNAHDFDGSKVIESDNPRSFDKDAMPESVEALPMEWTHRHPERCSYPDWESADGDSAVQSMSDDLLWGIGKWRDSAGEAVEHKVEEVFWTKEQISMQSRPKTRNEFWHTGAEKNSRSRYRRFRSNKVVNSTTGIAMDSDNAHEGIDRWMRDGSTSLSPVANRFEKEHRMEDQWV